MILPIYVVETLLVSCLQPNNVDPSKLINTAVNIVINSLRKGIQCAKDNDLEGCKVAHLELTQFVRSFMLAYEDSPYKFPPLIIEEFQRIMNLSISDHMDISSNVVDAEIRFRSLFLSMKATKDCYTTILP